MCVGKLLGVEIGVFPHSFLDVCFNLRAKKDYYLGGTYWHYKLVFRETVVRINVCSQDSNRHYVATLLTKKKALSRSFHMFT